MSDVTYFFGGRGPILRILVVGTLAYAALVSLQRISGKRTLSQMNAFDFLITVASAIRSAVFSRLAVSLSPRQSPPSRSWSGCNS